MLKSWMAVCDGFFESPIHINVRRAYLPSLNVKLNHMLMLLQPIVVVGLLWRLTQVYDRSCEHGTDDPSKRTYIFWALLCPQRHREHIYRRG
jgi:hypothetical protein